MTYTYKETVNRIVVWLDNARVGRLVCRKRYMEEGDEEKQLEAEHYAGAYQAAYSQAMRFWAEVDDTPDVDTQAQALEKYRPLAVYPTWARIYTKAQLAHRIAEQNKRIERLEEQIAGRNAEIADLRKRNEELEAMVADFQQFHSKQMNTILKLWKEIAELRQEAEKQEDTDA